MKTRTDLINKIIQKLKYETYLEIGVYEGDNFNKIQIKSKFGVDPNCGIDGVIRKFSQDFFKSNDKTFDIIFVDGDHQYNQVKQDVENSLKCISENGMVIMHDTCPPTLGHCGRYRKGEWCGDAYKVAIEYNNSKDHSVITWNKDFGVTIITKDTMEAKQFGFSFSDLTRNNYEAVNAQPIGIILEYIDFLGLSKNSEVDLIDSIELDNIQQKDSDVILMELKEYYKLNFPDRRIGRKKEETLIKELKDAGFEV